MNEFNTLRSLRSDVPLPSSDDLAPAYARLEQAMAAEASGGAALVGSGAVGSGSRSARPRRKSVKRRLAWIAGSMVGVVGLVFGAGQAAVAFNAQQTNTRLHEIAGAAVEFDEVTPGPGQYLLSSTLADWGVCEAPNDGDPTSMTCELNRQQIDIYMPSEPVAEWVMVRDWGDQANTDPDRFESRFERLTAPYGNFYAGDTYADVELSPEASGWLGVNLADIPTKSGEAAYAWIDGQYGGGSSSREEDNFVRITDILRSGLLPAKQRASLIEALALIPGVTSTPDVSNLDGVTGTAFGRTEAQREGERMEIIIDPETGLVIGERTISGTTAFGFAAGEVTGLTAITTTVVDAAPSDAVPATNAHPQASSGEDGQG